MGHLALMRTIRHAEAIDLVSRNVAAMVDTPGGQEGRPSKSLTLDQAVAVITAARTLPVIELRPGLQDVRRSERRRHGRQAAVVSGGLEGGFPRLSGRELCWDTGVLTAAST
jgi:hypothetical protein